MNGQTSGAVTFTVVDDTLVEGVETAALTISNPSPNITLGATTSQTIAITSDDLPLGHNLAVGGPNQTASLLVPNVSGVYGSPTATFTPFGGVAGSIRTATADVDGDGIEDTILVTGPGTALRVVVVSGVDNLTRLVQLFDPFGGDFPGGGFVAA